LRNTSLKQHTDKVASNPLVITEMLVC